jgi:hypothetical protein
MDLLVLALNAFNRDRLERAVIAERIYQAHVFSNGNLHLGVAG